jgi:hypothetical protein
MLNVLLLRRQVVLLLAREVATPVSTALVVAPLMQKPR